MLKAWLSQQSVWDMEHTRKQSMPLACAYLKAAADAAADLKGRVDNRIFNFGGGATSASVAQEVLSDPPDVLACSIFGWNLRLYGLVAELYKQLKPDGWVVFGGTHAANQALRIMREFPAVDVVVNGEGEITYPALLRAHLNGRSVHSLAEVPGVTFKTEDGTLKSTDLPPLIRDLDSIPSPFLSGAMPMFDSSGVFLYDVVLMETSRGCPYSCSFCYWGGAIGQKLRRFSLSRLESEIELFAKIGVENICLCDANFGMTQHDEEFLELLVRARHKYGYPRELITSWAKNKSRHFFNIVRKMKETGFHSSFTLALQSLAEPAIRSMRRSNMKLNEWQDLAAWLRNEGLDVYGELIWGCPGETYDSFLSGFDRLAEHVGRIATYPHLMLPNTEFSNNRNEYGIVTYRNTTDDFERVFAHESMTPEQNRRMHRFLFWARLLGEYPAFRYIYLPLRTLAGMTPSQLYLNLDGWIEHQADSSAQVMTKFRDDVVRKLDAYAIDSALHFFYREPELYELMQRWWATEIVPRFSAGYREFAAELFRFDWITRPRYVEEADSTPTKAIHGSLYYESAPVEFAFCIRSLVKELEATGRCTPVRSPRIEQFFHKAGFRDFIWNHEFYQQYVGRTRQEIEAIRNTWQLATEIGRTKVSSTEERRLRVLS